jgi:nucleotide-binding universal stress UspA family protein
MERQILVPLDGSLLAESVIPYAVELARAQGDALHLLRVITPATVAPSLAWPMPAPVNIERWLEADRQAARDYLNLLGNQIHAAEVKVQTTVAEGNPAEIIIGLTRSKVSTIDTIAMATHGRRGVERWVLGSVAEKVLHAAPVPLLLVRGTPSDTPPEVGPPYHQLVFDRSYRRIIVPLDGSDLAEQALEEARLLANALVATLVLVAVVPFWDDVGLSEPGVLPSWTIDGQQHLREYAAQYLESVAAPLRDSGLTVQTHWVDGDPPEAIAATAERESADLIVMATHGRSGFSRLWLGSVATQVVRRASVPVLMIRAKQVEHSVGKSVT